jgi:hypothetical protein
MTTFFISLNSPEAEAILEEAEEHAILIQYKIDIRKLPKLEEMT